MPNHVDVGQFPVERGLRVRRVVVGAPTDVKLISFRRKKFQHLETGNEMSEYP